MAGERALEAMAFEEAVRHLRLVLSMLDEDDAAARAPILDRIARAERSLGHLDDALARWDQALGAYEAIGDTASAARVCLDAAIQVAWWRRGREVTRLVERGLAAIGDGDNSTRAGLLAVAGMAASQAGPYERGEDLLEQALRHAMRQGDDRVIGLALYARAAHHFAYQEFNETVEFGLESIVYLRRVNDLWNLANVFGYVSSSLGWLGKFDRAAEIGSEGEALANRLGNWSAFVFAEQARVFRDIGGRSSAAALERRGRRALTLGRDMGFPWLLSVGHARVGLAAFWRGKWRDALVQFDKSASFEGRSVTGGHLGRLLLVHAYLGDRAAVGELLERARLDFPVIGRPTTARSWALAATAVEATRLVDRPDEAAALYDTMSALAATGVVMRVWDFRLVATLQGIAAGCTGEWDIAEKHFEEALRLSQDLPMRREKPEAQRFLAQMLLDRRRPADRDRAATLLDDAIRGYRSFRMPVHAELAGAVLRQPH
jgi:tetratricopeptide (TPR) repeat protein